jgi:hypothetical protein
VTVTIAEIGTVAVVVVGIAVTLTGAHPTVGVAVTVAAMVEIVITIPTRTGVDTEAGEIVTAMPTRTGVDIVAGETVIAMAAKMLQEGDILRTVTALVVTETETETETTVRHVTHLLMGWDVVWSGVV